MRRAAESPDLVDAVVRFGRQLRLWGVHVQPGASQGALQALREIDLASRDDFRAALRVTLVHRPEDFPLFDYLFNSFWGFGRRLGEASQASEAFSSRPVDSQRLGRTAEDPEPEDAPGDGAKRSSLRSVGEAAEPEGEAPIRTTTAAAVGRGTGEEVVPGVRPTEAAELDRLARRLGPVLATRRSRRWLRDPRGRTVDLRGALRGSLRYGGTPVDLPRRSRRIARAKLVLFCDVSRSMEEHAALFLRFSAAVLRRLWRVEVFLFASDVVRVTPLWLRETWADLKLRVPDCGGGTRIGDCLARFVEEYEASLLGSQTIVMVFSDGLDAGDPETLERALESVRRRSRSIFWLNPLIHLPGYEPTARGMSVALRYVDVFAPAHDLASLQQLTERLRELGGGERRAGWNREDVQSRAADDFVHAAGKRRTG